MSAQKKYSKVLFLSAIIFILMFSGMSVRANAAWKKNSNGTWSYYTNGNLVKSSWIGNTYYVDSKGIRKTGWLYINNKWYYFTKTGKLIRSRFIKLSGKMYYAGSDGALYVSGRYKIGKYYYAFSSRGVRIYGKRTFGGKTYCFGTKTGHMLTSQWVKLNKLYYYFDENGVMAANKWVGYYYVNGSGARIKSTWKDNRYLGTDGLAVKGLHKIGSVYYYFNTTTREKVVNTSLTLNNVTYKFDANGKGTITASNKAPATKVSVESTYYSDKYVDDETLLSAIIYCEAGNQTYTGQVAVGLVILNRVYDSRFPSKIREIIYQKQQFSPARDGSLKRALKNPSIVTESCKKAAAEVISRHKAHTSGSSLKLKIGSKNVTFSYLFFMTKPAYKRLGLTAKVRTIGDHVFFVNWK